MGHHIPTRQSREASKGMQEGNPLLSVSPTHSRLPSAFTALTWGLDYDELVGFIVDEIVNQNDYREESLERSVACLSLGLHLAEPEVESAHQSSHGRGGKKGSTLVSFRWIAAMVCLWEVERFEKSWR